MEILKYIIVFIGAVAYGSMTYFSVSAWFRLRCNERKLSAIQETMMHILMIAKGEHIRANLNMLNRMKCDQKEATEKEDFEQAERLRGIIKELEESTMFELEHFKGMFGKDSVVLLKT